MMDKQSTEKWREFYIKLETTVANLTDSDIDKIMAFASSLETRQTQEAQELAPAKET